MPISVPSGILIHPAIWPQHIYRPKIWGCAPLGEGQLTARSPSNQMWPGPRPTCVPSFTLKFLIHPTVWSRHSTPTLQTDRTGQDREDKQRSNIAYGEPFYKRSPQNSWTDRFAVFRCGLSWAEGSIGSTSSIVFTSSPGGAKVLTWRAHWRHLANTIESSVCYGDAALCQITLTACFYRAMHISAKRGIAIVILSVCLSITSMHCD